MSAYICQTSILICWQHEGHVKTFESDKLNWNTVQCKRWGPSHATGFKCAMHIDEDFLSFSCFHLHGVLS